MNTLTQALYQAQQAINSIPLDDFNALTSSDRERLCAIDSAISGWLIALVNEMPMPAEASIRRVLAFKTTKVI